MSIPTRGATGDEGFACTTPGRPRFGRSSGEEEPGGGPEGVLDVRGARQYRIPLPAGHAGEVPKKQEKPSLGHLSGTQRGELMRSATSAARDEASSSALTPGRSRIASRVFITWYPYCRRSDALAEQLGARSYLIHYLRFKVPYLAPIKYVLQSLKTVWVLLQERPSVVLVANPPVVAPFIVWLGSFILRYRFIIDAHSGAFQHSRWSWSLPLQRFLARRALTSVVTNSHMADAVRSWGGRVELVQDLSLNLNLEGAATRHGGFH